MSRRHHWHRILFTGLGGIHLVLVLLCSTDSLLHNQIQYGGTTTTQPRVLASLLRADIIAGYTHTSGISCGYGFYAPRVGSHFATIFTLYDQAGNRLTTLQHPLKGGLEGRIRYRSFLDQYTCLLPSEAGPDTVETVQRRIARATAVSMAEYLLRAGRATRVTCEVFVWRPEPLWPNVQNGQTGYVPIYRVDAPYGS